MGKLRLKNKTVLVTVAARGLGKQLARYLVTAEQVNLILVDRNASELEDAAEEIRHSSPARVVTIVRDLLEAPSPRELFEELKGEDVFGLINNAGLTYYGETEKLALDLFKAIIDLDFKVVVELSLLFLSRFKEQGQGFILNVTSLASFIPIPYQAVYAAAKSAVQSFSECLYAENSNPSIVISTFAPAGIVTDMIRESGLTAHMHRHMYSYFTPERAAELAIKALVRKKRLIIPGFFNKVVYVLLDILPRGFLIGFTRRIFRHEKYRAAKPGV